LFFNTVVLAQIISGSSARVQRQHSATPSYTNAMFGKWLLRAIDAAVPTDIHLVVDNYSTHPHPKSKHSGDTCPLTSALCVNLPFVAESARAVRRPHHRLRYPSRLGRKTSRAKARTTLHAAPNSSNDMQV
jgi:hypothetical protein